MKSNFYYFFRHIFTKTWNFLHILRRLYQESKRMRSVWRFLWNASLRVSTTERSNGKTLQQGYISHRRCWGTRMYEKPCVVYQQFQRVLLHDSHIPQTYELTVHVRNGGGGTVAKTTATLFSTLKRHTFDAALPGVQKPKEPATDFHERRFLGYLRSEIMKVKTVKSRVSKKNEFLRWGFVKIHALVTRSS